MIDYSSFSQAGVRGLNQDSVLVCNTNKTSLLAIADGIGGKEAGDHASRIAIETLESKFNEQSEIKLAATFIKVKANIVDYAVNNNIKEIGTTLTACLIKENKVVVAHVGDTRLYHLRNNGIITITKDQTEVQKLLDDGILSKKRAEIYHRRNVLLSAITNYSEYSLFEAEFFVDVNDRLVLLTDGAYNLIKKIEIRDLSIQSQSISKFVEASKRVIESREIKDDYSLLACEIIKNS